MFRPIVAKESIVRRGLRTLGVTTAALTSFLLVGGAASSPGAAAPPAAPQADPAASLTADLDAILANPGVAGETASVQVSTAAGQVLYSHEADRRLNPASNLKLFTSAAALDVLGLDFRFGTDVSTNARSSHGVLRGNLYLRGRGDPTLLASDYEAMAAKVASSGVRIVTGRLIADDTYFDDVRLGNSWSWDDEPYYYSQQASALTISPDTDYDNGNVIVETRPGATPGAKPRLTLVPKTGYVHLINRATTSTGTANTISVDREHGNNDIVVTGTIGTGHPAADKSWATVFEPTGYAADVFRRALARHGVQVAGQTGYAATPAGTRELATHESMPLAQMYLPFLKLSNNGHAEALVKTVGQVVAHDGSWDAGLQVIAEHLASFGIDPAVIHQVDGSGLSRQDLVPADQITRLLVAAQSKPWFATWYDALPIAGNPDRLVGGTLRSRLAGTAAAGMHGKTGSLTGVSALSGYVTDADGQRLIFSVLQNGYVHFNAKTIEDQIAIRVAQFGHGAAAANGVPRVPAAPA
ncbi:MAG: D-alanyl-D-alanine carboxypeptidase/D-alanyl-D-alanine-endopeptidase, partial [Pseudonocardiales bacterium]